MRPLISLVMMVKNEAASIRQVLESVKPHIDRWVILDTGSTDGTADIVRDVLASLPGKLHEEPFVDYGATRNRLLDLHAEGVDPSEFTLMLSGDEYLRGGDAMRSYLTMKRDSGIDCFLVRVNVDEAFVPSPRVLRTGSTWRYEKRVHEFPANRAAKEPPPIDLIMGASIDHEVANPEKRYENIWENHIPLLKEELEKDPNDTHALVYLAQSYENLFMFFSPHEQTMYAMEAMALYLRRLALPFSSEAERNYIQFHYLDDARLAGVYTDRELFERASRLVEADPQRPEVALMHAQLAMKVLPLKQVYLLFRHAAEVAANASNIINGSPVSTTCGWKAHHLAAAAAKQLALKLPSDAGVNDMPYRELVRSHISAGLAAGGSWDVFKKLTESPAPAASSG